MEDTIKGVFVLLVIAGVAVLGVGWVLNIIDLFGLAKVGDITAMLVLRAVGVFVAPLGGFLGYI